MASYRVRHQNEPTPQYHNLVMQVSRWKKIMKNHTKIFVFVFLWRFDKESDPLAIH